MTNIQRILNSFPVFQFSSVTQLCPTWIQRAPLMFSIKNTISWSLLKLISIDSVMPSNHLILCHPLLLLPLVFPSIRVFSKELTLQQMAKVLELQVQHQSPSEYSRLISFRIDCLILQSKLFSRVL